MKAADEYLNYIRNMWLYYLLLAVGAAQAGKRQRVIKGPFREGIVKIQSADNTTGLGPNVFNQNSQIVISGGGTILKSGKTSLNIQVEIQGPAAQGGGGPAAPGGGGAGPAAAPGGRPAAPGGGPAAPGGGGAGPAGGAGPLGPGAGAAGPGGAGTGGTSAEAGEEFTEEEQTGLLKHNEFRKVHGAPPMTLDRQMCDKAQEYAKRIADMGTLQHSSSQERDGNGENLSMGCSSNQAQAVEEAVTNWYNEVCDPGYDFNNGGFSGGTGHFTQVVWKGSTVLGIGRAEIDQGGMKCAYIVGRYKPAGNMGGEYQQNVLKGSFNAQSYCASVSNKKRKFFDENGQAVMVNAPMSAVDVPVAKTRPAKFQGKHVIELLNSKKKKTTVAHKRN